MSVIHLFTVHPLAVEPDEVPHVQIGNFYLEAESPEAAWELLKDHRETQGAVEVWAAPLETMRITPSTQLSERADLYDHTQWKRWQMPYKQLLQA
jgi:hypothetical protein